jgi:hypothetical protein
MGKVNANKSHKDSVFTLLFSEKKERLISLYNALSGSNYPDDAEIEINTLKDALIMNRLNDISFEIDGKIVVLIEYQSTLNRNMPLRCFLYAARVYEKILDGKNIYRDSLIKIPKPEVYICYNGKERLAEKDRAMKLSDAFMAADTSGDYEWTAEVFDINKKHNGEILQKSKILDEYAEFIETVRKIKQTGVNLDEALAEAVKVCVNKGILKEFLETHGSEVCNMLFVEFDIDAAKEVWLEEGMEKGEKKKAVEMAKKAIKKGLSLEDIADLTELNTDIIKELQERLKV